MNRYCYYEDVLTPGRWFWGSTVGSNNADCFCNKDITDPTTELCNTPSDAFYCDNELWSDIEVTLAACPDMRDTCDYIRITGGDNTQDCDGIYDAYYVSNGDINDINIWKHRTEEKYFWFDAPSFKWHCGSGYYPCSTNFANGEIIYNSEDEDEFGLQTVTSGGSFDITNFGYLTDETTTLECEPSDVPTMQTTMVETTTTPEPTTPDTMDTTSMTPQPTNEEPLTTTTSETTTPSPTTQKPTRAPLDDDETVCNKHIFKVKIGNHF